MRLPILSVAVVAATTALTACSGTDLAGGAGGPIVTTPTPNDRLSYREVANISDDIFQGIRDESPTAKANVPTSGGASYGGTMGAELDVAGRQTDIAALMQMDVDFGRDRVGGIIGNVVTSDGYDVDGVLTLRNGNLNRRSNSREVAIFSGVEGNLTSAAGERITVDADLVGGFAGRNVDYVGATIDGNVFVDGRQGTIDGAAALER